MFEYCLMVLPLALAWLLTSAMPPSWRRPFRRVLAPAGMRPAVDLFGWTFYLERRTAS